MVCFIFQVKFSGFEFRNALFFERAKVRSAKAVTFPDRRTGGQA